MSLHMLTVVESPWPFRPSPADLPHYPGAWGNAIRFQRVVPEDGGVLLHTAYGVKAHRRSYRGRTTHSQSMP